MIESGLGKSAVIKSHHNVGGLPEHVDFKEIIEPLRMLFKDEVRRAGLELGIPENLVYRQPFPGPGLGVRIIGEANPNCLLSNSNAYGVTIAEHTVMVTLMLLRQMPAYLDAARAHRWAAPAPVRSIHGCRVTILGTGDLGGNIARRMRGMGAEKIIGLSRSGKAREAGIFDETYPISQLDRLLSDAELLVMALPNTPETVNILNRERIARLPKNAIVINVGRGSALDQAALAEALNTDRIAGAALDVVDPEPLPENDPLWDTKHLILTPHISGNLTLGYTCDRNVELFCEDLANYAAGRPLSHLVDRKRGY